MKGGRRGEGKRGKKVKNWNRKQLHARIWGKVDM